DEAIAASRALWLFRADTLLYAGACAGIALVAGPPRPRRRGAVAALLFGGAAVWISLQAERLHWKASDAQLDAELGGRMVTPSLRHELVHAIGADIAHGPWGTPGGLIPQMALVEGVAVAADWPPGEFTAHEEARALRELKLLPDVGRLFKPGLFYAESGPRAY